MSEILNDAAEQTTETGLNESQANENQTADDAQNESATTEEFSAAEWETQFGLDAGSLKDCTSVEDVLKAVAETADKTILAGLTAAPAAEADASPFSGQQPAPKNDPTSGKTGNAELDALKQELGLLREEIIQSKKSAETAQLSTLSTRLDKEIDGWASPKYGVGTNRNSKQYREYKALREEMRTYVAGQIAMGRAVSTDELETIARRVRVFHDDTYKPTKPTSKQTPLGTPGTTKDARASVPEARNIHDLVLRSGK